MLRQFGKGIPSTPYLFRQRANLILGATYRRLLAWFWDPVYRQIPIPILRIDRDFVQEIFVRCTLDRPHFGCSWGTFVSSALLKSFNQRKRNSRAASQIDVEHYTISKV
ncbi:hypothetical protein [Bosea sp. BIWAKO-01]|uniref:hypothetical protein n=1 Tax=Bosea sp. BIWAKO-01 TaxID=506668 RepID=UPI00114CFC2E|nr:hypothetical protein [Bosea sp. BIWAKO-01]